MLLRYYQASPLSENHISNIISDVNKQLGSERTIVNIETESCFYISFVDESVSDDVKNQIIWILSTPFKQKNLSENSFLRNPNSNERVVEIGPRLNFSTPFSSNACSIFNSIGIESINRIERSTKYLLTFSHEISLEIEEKVVCLLHDHMTQCRYDSPLMNFDIDVKKEDWYEVDILNNGKDALVEVNEHLGLALDQWDIDYYFSLFKNKLLRNPTSVECFDLAQSNSEHSRHWFFKGKMVIDGVVQDQSLLEMVMSTQLNSNLNNVIKFSDNSSAILGYEINLLTPQITHEASSYQKHLGTRHIIFTAETHNFPTGICPFSGAATGSGGRIRDVQAAGRGAHVIAGTAGYCVGNLHLPDYELAWENTDYKYPSTFAHPREVIIDASDGASDYGNKFGEPLVAGFTRSFGLTMSDGERREWVKPIMFSGGIGSIDEEFVQKNTAVKGMEVVKIGGPVYRIGIGGGAASSVEIQGSNKSELDFTAVQRGDPEMEQKLNRVVRACIEMGSNNPICSIHDQGAGGNGNVLKELVEPSGAIIYTKEFQLGDPTIDTFIIWGAEYQESNAVLVNKKDVDVLKVIGERERCPISFVGQTTDDNRIQLVEGYKGEERLSTRHPVDMELDVVLGKMPQKVFNLTSRRQQLLPLVVPQISVYDCLRNVLKLPSVGSKRFLTNKVDRCVTGLIAQQQCIGPLHLPLADSAVVALSYFDTVGAATSIGEQPIKGLIDPAVGARMSVAEALTNLMFTPITSIKDIKCSANWMWAAKLPGEGAALHSACKAMTDVMKTLGIAVDGGKDSLSMAARVGSETVKTPGSLVVSCYAPCYDIRLCVTPDLKCPNESGSLLYIDLAPNKMRLGGSAFAQTFSQIGNVSPDLDQPELLRDAFNIMQSLLKERTITAGHDVSDGGVIVCLLEMAFAGNCGVKVNFNKASRTDLELLFCEEVGWIIEVQSCDEESVVKMFDQRGICCSKIGCSLLNQNVEISVRGNKVLSEEMPHLRDCWEETSFQLELRQCNPKCVKMEKQRLSKRKAPLYISTSNFVYTDLSSDVHALTSPPLVAILREEGTNSDREMAAAFFTVGFQVWDVTMTDLISNSVDLDRFRGLVFPGGFSYGDVLGSAKGWAAGLFFNKGVKQKLDVFRSRDDTFSLGVCNGCQLMATLGWIVPNKTQEEMTSDNVQGVGLLKNESERFECRFSTVKIMESASMMLRNMAGSTLGVWVAHGEGNFTFRNNSLYDTTKQSISLVYVDDDGQATTDYPFNPNGSIGGIAGICSDDGRHLALMPHPERTFQLWQWPWLPRPLSSVEWKHSPWLEMFSNAFKFCVEN